MSEINNNSSIPLPDNNDMNTEHKEPSQPGVGRIRAAGEIKPSELVLAAIHHLVDSRGSTLKEILDYVSREYNCDSHMKRAVATSLKRGVQYGIIKHDRGHYSLQPGYDEDKIILQARARGRCAPKRPKRKKSACGRSRPRKISKRKCACSQKRKKSHVSRRGRSRCGAKRGRSSRHRSSRRKSSRGSKRCGSRRKGSRGSRRSSHRRKSKSKRSSRRGCIKLPNFCGIPKKKKRSAKKSSRKGCAPRKPSKPRCQGKKPRRCSQDENEDE